MPIHDWTRVDAGLFHHFHQDWTIELCRRLNSGCLPAGYTALTDQRIGGPIPDVLTLSRHPRNSGKRSAGGVAVEAVPPQARYVEEVERETYTRRANRITIRHRHGEVVAIIEIISPGNKSSRNALNDVVRKTEEAINQGIHLLFVDLFPPSERDPHGLHGLLWEDLSGRVFQPPTDKPLTAFAYHARPTLTAYVEPLAVGDELPSLPIFLNDYDHVPAPLEATYQASWAVFPDDFKTLLTEPPSPNGETAP